MRWRVSLLMFLVLPLTLVGCGGDGDGDGAKWHARLSLRPRVAWRISLLSFPTGLTPNFATRFGLPAGQAFSLQFGTFTGTTAPLTFEAGGQTATGTVTLGSCIFQFDQSTFRTGQGPQGGTQVLANPCETEVTLRFLRLTDPPSQESVTSAAPIPLTSPNTAFVLTTDFQDRLVFRRRSCDAERHQRHSAWRRP